MSVQQDHLADLRARIIRIVCRATGLHERLALPVAESICHELSRDMGGAEIYIPSTDRRVRNAALRRDFRGNNHDDIMRRYGISRATLYRILGSGQKKQIKRP